MNQVRNFLDVVALDPSTDANHARIKLTAWLRLWTWCGAIHDDILAEDDLRKGIERLGEEPIRLGAETARALGEALALDLSTGVIDEAIRAMLDHYASLDLVDCSTCEGTGIRSDEIGTLLGLPSIVLDDLRAIALGRSEGTCDVCDGLGRHADPSTVHTFDVDVVDGFARFLRESGGVVIL